MQSAHFPGRQCTLHNTVNGEKNYAYHLSDDTNHKSVMTFNIIVDIIKNYSELDSDKCQEQYKCKFTFFQMKKLAIELGIKIVWFFEPGYCFGLVDAMSSFSCKSQLRSEIITNDSWFERAERMVKFLKDYFQSHDSKEYFLVDAAETAKIQKHK